MAEKKKIQDRKDKDLMRLRKTQFNMLDGVAVILKTAKAGFELRSTICPKCGQQEPADKIETMIVQRLGAAAQLIKEAGDVIEDLRREEVERDGS
jgi:hypothetical protein